jgi:hypothetical protein
MIALPANALTGVATAPGVIELRLNATDRAHTNTVTPH